MSIATMQMQYQQQPESKSRVDKMDDVEIVEEAGVLKPAHGGLNDHAGLAKTPEEAKAEQRFVWKIDLLIMPLISITYFLGSMDRGDIGNAAAAGMVKQLKLTPGQLSNAVSLFYVGYILLQLPGDLLLRVITPPIQLGAALMTWGTFTCLLSVANNYPTIAGLRILIGAGEAFIQAAPLYLTLWYKRDELAKRAAIVFSMSALAGSMNGLIAYGVLENLNGLYGRAAWRWIFLIEGVISVGYGVIIMLVLPPVPEKIRWGYSAKEKAIAVRRTEESYNVVGAKINLQHLLELVKDPKIYFLTVIYCCLNTSLAAFGSYLPVILEAQGRTPLHTQLLTIPVYVCTAAAILLLGYASDRTKQRGIMLMGSFAVAAAGWLMLILSSSKNLSFGATFLIGIGTYPTVMLTQAWMNSNIIGFTKRAGALAMINMFGQCLSIAGSEAFKKPPHYYGGEGFSFGMMALGFCTSAANYIYLRRQNAIKIRDQGSEDAARLRQLNVEQISEHHPDFFYFL